MKFFFFLEYKLDVKMVQINVDVFVVVALTPIITWLLSYYHFNQPLVVQLVCSGNHGFESSCGVMAYFSLSRCGPISFLGLQLGRKYLGY